LNQAITYDDVLLVPSYNTYESRRDVSTHSIDMNEKLSLDIPVISANMDTITEHGMANFMSSKGGIGALHRFMSIEKNVNEFVLSNKNAIVSVGVSKNEMERAEALYDAGAEYFCVDVAHGHASYVGRALGEIRKKFSGNVCIIAGNVATYEGAQFLVECGADIIKVGIGGGSVCSTRIKTGFGVPNLTAIQECSRVDRSIIADGGIRTSGDVVKALAFGADFVMIGGMLSGVEHTPGDRFIGKDGLFYKVYRGMASKEVQDDYLGGMPEWKTAEGVSTYVDCRNNANEIIADIVGGLRSGLTYAGAANISELQRKLNYVMITNSGRVESLPHKTL
jgi:IMP dehydrogenase